MICPKCGFEQPESPECMRCGVIVSRYKGPVLEGASPTPPPMPSLASPAFEAPGPALAGAGTAGTVYGGPPPAAVGGGTVYQGPPPGSPAAGAARSPFKPVFVGTQLLPVGETLGTSFSIYFRNIIPFTILTAVAFSPIYLGAALLSREFSKSPAAAGGIEALTGLVSLLLCIPISTAAITYGVFQEMRGRTTSIGSCLSVGLSSLLPVLSVALLQILIVFGAMIAVLVPGIFLLGGMLVGGTRSSAACSIMLVPVIFLLCLVPALMLGLKYYVAVPAAVEERPGAFGALRRSAFLTEGNRGRIFGVLLVPGFINVGMSLVVALMPGVGSVLDVLVDLLTTGLFATLCAVIYYRLRSFHESIDVDQIASVFD